MERSKDAKSKVCSLAFPPWPLAHLLTLTHSPSIKRRRGHLASPNVPDEAKRKIYSLSPSLLSLRPSYHRLHPRLNRLSPSQVKHSTLLAGRLFSKIGTAKAWGRSAFRLKTGRFQLRLSVRLLPHPHPQDLRRYLAFHSRLRSLIRPS
jgi:hypothetical protein